MSDPSLTPFFRPKGVVAVGVSRDPTKLGYFLARNLLASGYGGAIHFVNPHGGELLGLPIYPSIEAVPDPADLAVLLVPPAATPASLEECGRRGIRAVIIAAGGFKETGAEGVRLEKQCLEIAQANGIRLIGPNCIGLINTHLPIDTTFLQPPGPPIGEVAVISQSGAMCAAIIDWVRGQGFGLSHLLSLGNQVDVTETDTLEPVADDPKTAAIALYIEMIADGERFVEVARRVSRRKPLVALKVGRYESGRRAAASHTGALAGAEVAYDAAFRRGGVIRANTTEELLQWARALAWSPLPKGRNVAVLTNSGGPGVAATDALEGLALKLAKLSQGTMDGLRSILIPAASVHNPVDMIASATPEMFVGSLKLLLADSNVDMVLVISPPPPPSTTGALVKAMMPLIQTTDKPVVLALMGDRLIGEAVELARAVKVPEYRFPEQAASALAALVQRAELLSRLDEEPACFEDVDRASAERLLRGQPAGEFVSQDVAAGLLEAYGIASVRPVLASTAIEAVDQAEKIGYPVVIKVASADIPHKSDIGGVLLGLNSAREVEEGFKVVIERARQARPEAKIDGVHVQKMLSTGQEVITGVIRDPQFGPLVMFGSGGVEVEGLKDVAFGLAPLSREEAGRMLESTWAGRKLNGFRNLPPADRTTVIETLARLGQLARDLPAIAEIEINPLRVLERGAWAVDIRARMK